MEVVEDYIIGGTSTVETMYVLLSEFTRVVTTEEHSACIKGTATELREWAADQVKDGAAGVTYQFDIGCGWWNCTYTIVEEGTWEDA